MNIIKSGKERNIDHGYEYPLRYVFVLSRHAIILEDVGITSINAMLYAHKVNFRAVRLFGWIQATCSITLKSSNSVSFVIEILSAVITLMREMGQVLTLKWSNMLNNPMFLGAGHVGKMGISALKVV